MRSAAIVIFLLIALFPPHAMAWNEPDNFRGIPWGASLDDARRTLLDSWKPSEQLHGHPECPPAKARCVQKGKLGPIDVTFVYTFKDDRFVSALIMFKAADYKAVRTILTERYGAPTTQQRIEIRTKVGVPHESELGVWRGEKVSVMLERFHKRVDEGLAGVAMNAYLQEGIERRQEEIKKGKDDL